MENDTVKIKQYKYHVTYVYENCLSGINFGSFETVLPEPITNKEHILKLQQLAIENSEGGAILPNMQILGWMLLEE